MGNCVVLLVNDMAGPGMMAEHGLSIYIEVDGLKILLDCGQGKSLAINAWQLGLDVTHIDALVLSHGHYDHTGGVAQVLALIGRPALYCHCGAIQPRYALHDGEAKAIHMPDVSIAAMAALPENKMHWVARYEKLSEAVGLTGPVPRQTPYEDPCGPFFLDTAGTRPDMIEDDQAVWIHTEEGLVVCVGCSHAGIVNTLNYVREISGHAKIHGVIGGFHLLNADDRRLEQTLAALKELDPDWLVPCHCTGDRAIQILKNGLGDRVRPGRAGMCISLPSAPKSA